MSVNDVLMKPGSWSLTLKSDMDLDARRALTEFGHIVITPTPIDVRVISDTDMLGTQARYVGVLLERPSSNQLQGAGLAWHLGAEDGVGPLLESTITKSSATMSAWLTDILAGGSPWAAIASGTLTNTGLASLSWTSPKYITVRQAVDYVCLATGAVWRVQNNGTLDVAAPSTLLATTPTNIVLRKEGGPDSAINGLQVDLLTEGLDASNYTTKVVVVAQGEGNATPVGSASQATSYKDLRGNALVVKRVVDSPTTNGATDAATVAQSTLNLFTSAKRPINLSTDTYDIGRYLRPGDYIYVYDLLSGLYDPTGATQVTYRGMIMAPVALQVLAVTWPIQQGMGVYYRDLNGTYTDLTTMVEFESGATNYEVGDYVRTSSPNLDVVSTSAPVVARTNVGYCSCSIARAAAQSIPNITDTDLVFDTEYEDTSSFFAPSATTATLPSTGGYVVSGQVDVAGAPGATSAINLKLNGTQIAKAPLDQFGDGSTSFCFRMAAGATLGVSVYQSSGGALNATGSLQILKVSD